MDACLQCFSPPTVLKGSDVRENILPGESVLVHDLSNTSPARYPQVCSNGLRFKEEADLNEGLQWKSAFSSLVSGTLGHLPRTNFGTVLPARQA